MKNRTEQDPGQPSPPGLVWVRPDSTSDPVSPVRVRSKPSDGYSPARTDRVRPDSSLPENQSDKARNCFGRSQPARTVLSPPGLKPTENSFLISNQFSTDLIPKFSSNNSQLLNNIRNNFKCTTKAPIPIVGFCASRIGAEIKNFIRKTQAITILGSSALN